MALTDITQSILDQAKKQANSIATEADRAAGQIIQTAESKAWQIKQETKQTAKQIKQKELQQGLATCRLNNHQQQAALRRQLIDELLAEISLSLADLPDDQYSSWLESKLTLLPTDFAGQIRLAPKAKDQALKLIAKYCPKAEITFDSTITAGLLASDQNQSYNLTLNHWLKLNRPQLEIKLGSILFQ